MIVDHQPKGRHKRFDEDLLKSLDALLQGSPSDILLEAALEKNAASLKEIITRSRLESGKAESALRELLNTGILVPLEDGEININNDILVVALQHWKALREKVMRTVDAYHKTFPLRRGIPREELKSRLKLSPRVFNAVIKKLINENAITDQSAFVAGAGHEVTFHGQDQARIQMLKRRFEQNPFSPPSVRECQADVGEELLYALVEIGEFVMVSSEVIFRKEEYDFMVTTVRNTVEQSGRISLAEVRDLFNTSRKYAQALLEHLDSVGMTVRDGDHRRLKKK